MIAPADIVVVDLTSASCGGRAPTLFSAWVSRASGDRCLTRTVSFDPSRGADPAPLLAAIADADAVIVTGTEPSADRLADDPAAQVVALIVEVVDDQELPACFSCLAAHAALAARHGDRRRRLPAKLSGTYPHTVDPAHALSRGMPPQFSAPHSRWFSVDRERLPELGVTPLDAQGDHGWLAATESDDPGSLYLQGHPEYASVTLFREYRRDFYRALRGEAHQFPSLPENSLDASHAARLEALDLRARAGEVTVCEVLPEFVAPDDPVAWAGPASTLLQNWLRQPRSAGGPR